MGLLSDQLALARLADRSVLLDPLVLAGLPVPEAPEALAAPHSAPADYFRIAA